MRFIPQINFKRSYWLIMAIVGLLFMLSPFMIPSAFTMVLFFPGLPMMTTGLMLFIFYKRNRLKRWEFRDCYCITVNEDKTWTAIRYSPSIAIDSELPEHARPYMRDYRYIIPLKGWTPLTKYEGVFKKIRRVFRNLIKSRRIGMLLFAYDVVDGNKAMAPINHSHSYSGIYDEMSPEFLQKVCESKLASNFSKSLDTGKLKLNWIIIAIIIIVALAIILKLTGAV
jgi:hypothetical protein